MYNTALIQFETDLNGNKDKRIARKFLFSILAKSANVLGYIFSISLLSLDLQGDQTEIYRAQKDKLKDTPRKGTSVSVLLITLKFRHLGRGVVFNLFSLVP